MAPRKRYVPVIKSAGKIALIVGFTLVGCFLFYWFQIRTTQIRKNCANEAVGSNSAFTLHMSSVYRVCLAKNGLEPASLLVGQ